MRKTTDRTLPITAAEKRAKVKLIVLVIISYLLGSVPFGLIIAKAYGKDLRSIGSGNIGATNLSRALGRKWGYVCFVLDTTKGLVPMLAAGSFVTSPPTTVQLVLWLAVGCAAISGHIFPVYVRFRGGKGVATSLGVVLGLWPYYTLCAPFAFAVWIISIFLWRYISLASIAAAASFPLFLTFAITLTPSWHFADLWPLLIAAIAMPLLVVLRHSDNIKRLLAGTESKAVLKG